MPANLENSAVVTGLEKVSFHSNLKERQWQWQRMFTHHIVALISHFSKVILKILQARPQWTKNWNLGGSAEGPEIKLKTLLDHRKSKRIPEKYLLHWQIKALTVWITTNCGKFLRIEIPDRLTCLLRNLFAGQEATVQPDIEQQSGSKLGKDYIRCVYYHLANITYMQSTSCRMLDWRM